MTNLPSVTPKEMRALAKLVCVECGAPGEASCNCGAPYVPPGQRAAEAVRQNPEKSDRAIAEELGIGHQTVMRAREKTTGPHGPVEPRTGLDGKTRRMPRRKSSTAEISEATRQPKGRKPDEVQRQASINVHPEDWERFKEQAAEEGVSAAAKLGAVVAGTEVDPATLSLSAQQKLEAAIRQEKRRLQGEFERVVQTEIERAISETVLPQYNKEMAEARQVIASRKGIMPRATYRVILSCLHPDRVTEPELKEKYADAFRAFQQRELVLCSEKEMPTAPTAMPRNYEELMKRRAEVKARRKQQRHQNAVQSR